MTFGFSYFEWPLKTGLMYTELVNHGSEEVSNLRIALIFQHDILSINPLRPETPKGVLKRKQL